MNEQTQGSTLLTEEALDSVAGGLPAVQACREAARRMSASTTSNSVVGNRIGTD